ncbi:hypothetical protein DERP_015362 [Dermatophagoides pteronyssinus]|uniref:Uncharacterized protein n=1 Tax=Dermatophagoides pteronyssinus TaxID=6956 RepID=A0ABQ8JBD5_DERPT|nr:hypothetical protein DERP_015362 [Dermatophagoides pteronyssinus]
MIKVFYGGPITRAQLPQRFYLRCGRSEMASSVGLIRAITRSNVVVEIVLRCDTKNNNFLFRRNVFLFIQIDSIQFNLLKRRLSEISDIHVE